MEQTGLFEKNKKKRVNITVDPELWKAFQRTCEQQHTNASKMVEMLAREFVEKNRQIKLL